MRPVGAHLPLGKGFGPCLRTAHGFGMTALQVFTSSPRMWRGGPPDAKKATDLAAAVADTGVNALVSHDTYLVNLVASDPEVAAKSRACLKEELERSAAYGIPHVVSHLGAAPGQDPADARKRLAEIVGELLAEIPPGVTLLAETTAGQGSVLHARFEELAELMERTGRPDNLGVCFDTCHVHAAGYDLAAPDGWRKTIDEFDAVVGLDRLKVFHVNDSKHPAGSRKDRHANLGEGTIGETAFRDLLADERLGRIPLILETPQEGDAHLNDFARLREWDPTGPSVA